MRATKTMKPGDDESPTKDAAASSGAAGNDESSGAAKTPTKDEFEVEFDRNDKGKAALLHGIFPRFSSACLTPGSDARLYNAKRNQSLRTGRRVGGRKAVQLMLPSLVRKNGCGRILCCCRRSMEGDDSIIIHPLCGHIIVYMIRDACRLSVCLGQRFMG